MTDYEENYFKRLEERHSEVLDDLNEAICLLARAYLSQNYNCSDRHKWFLMKFYGEWNQGVEEETFEEWLRLAAYN